MQRELKDRAMPAARGLGASFPSPNRIKYGKRSGAFQPTYYTCTYFQCPYRTRRQIDMQRHVTFNHYTCNIRGCRARYTLPQMQTHLILAHGHPDPTLHGTHGCRFRRCQWRGSWISREKHESAVHVRCGVLGCRYRGTRILHMRHERLCHLPTDPQQRYNKRSVRVSLLRSWKLVV